MRLLWILVLVEIILFYLSFQINKQDIMAPSVMVTAVFIFSTFLVILNIEKWDVDFKPITVFMISMGLLVFVLGDASIVKFCRRNKKIFINYVGVISISRWKVGLTLIFDFIILLFVYKEVLRVANTGASFSNLFYAYRMVAHSTSKTPEQYMNSAVVQMIKIVMCSGFIFGFVFINNVVLCKQRIISNIKYLIPGFIMSAITLLTGNRTNILRLLICLLLCAYILLQYQKNWSLKVSKKFVKILVISVSVIFLLFSISQILLGRSGATGVVDVISNYAGAGIQLFNLYLGKPAEKNMVWGQETFQAVWALLYRLGMTKNNISAFLEFRTVSKNNIGNIYTLFRKYYQDFGFVGMLFATFLTATFFSWLYNYRIKYSYFGYKAIRTMIVYGYLYYAITISSVDNFLNNYMSIGTLILYIVFRIMFSFFFGKKVYQEKNLKIVLKVMKEQKNEEKHCSCFWS